MALPKKLTLEQLQTKWPSQIDPVLNFAPNKGTLLTNIALVTGSNVINHKLGKTQQGWIVTDQTAAASLYRSAAFNNLTLTLTASAPTTVNLWCY
jgi:hypothetical protein